MSWFPTSCPDCDADLELTRLTCPGCAIQLEGHFELPELVRLSRDDQEFVLAFVRCSGSLKDLGKLRGKSYPTIRKQLDEVVARLTAGDGEGDGEQTRRRILEALARGELDVKEADRKLKEVED